jgi:hypothetical protein
MNELIRVGGGRTMRPQTVTTNNNGIKKIVTAAQRQGNPGIAKQQFTELEIFDYLPLPSGGNATLNFFENVRTRQFPFTNLTENKLQPGEMMILKRVWFTIMSVDFRGDIINVTDFDDYGIPGLYASLWNWFNDNTRVVKNKSLVSFKPSFNKGAFNDKMNVKEVSSEITIPTQVAFTSTLQLPPVNFVSEETLYIGLHAEGIGTILNPKSPY